MPRPNRSILIAVTILVAIPVLSTVVWLRAEHGLAARVERGLAGLREQGFTVSEGGRRRGGWPLAASLTIEAPRLAGPVAPPRAPWAGRVAWGAGRIVLRVDLLHPRALTVTAGPRQEAVFAPAGRPSGTDTGDIVRLTSGRMRLRFDGDAPGTPWFHVGTDMARLSWGAGEAGGFLMLVDPRASVGLDPDAPPDGTRAALDLQARLLATSLAPIWLRPWPPTGVTFRAALVAPRRGEARGRLLVQEASARIGAADARFAGVFASPLPIATGPGTTSPGGTGPMPDGSGTLILTGAYAAFQRWLDASARDAADTTMPVHLDPATIQTLRRLLPRTPSGTGPGPMSRTPTDGGAETGTQTGTGQDRLFLPIRVVAGALVLPHERLFDAFGQALTRDGGKSSNGLFVSGH